MIDKELLLYFIVVTLVKTDYGCEARMSPNYN